MNIKALKIISYSILSANLTVTRRLVVHYLQGLSCTAPLIGDICSFITSFIKLPFTKRQQICGISNYPLLCPCHLIQIIFSIDTGISSRYNS